MSETLVLSPESINAYKTIIEDPGAYSFNFKLLNECFEKSEKATPKHLLFAQYVEYINAPLPKVIFYIIMDNLYPVSKASNGDLGYNVKLKSGMNE